MTVQEPSPITSVSHGLPHNYDGGATSTSILHSTGYDDPDEGAMDLYSESACDILVLKLARLCWYGWRE